MPHSPPDEASAWVPRHIAVIMDGNGRWAKKRHLSRVEGHKQGKEAVRAIVEASRRLGVEYLTLYAFSTENWERPAAEVRALMGMLRRYLRTELSRMMESKIRLRAVGDLERLPADVQRLLGTDVAATRQNSGLTVILAVSYGSREEIAAAARSIARAVKRGHLDPDSIDQKTVAEHLWTAGIPDPDLLIRTGGEMRLSNFLLWQMAYTELYVTDTMWPDFGEEELTRAIGEYRGRQRRFGRVGDAGVSEPSRALKAG